MTGNIKGLDRWTLSVNDEGIDLSRFGGELYYKLDPFKTWAVEKVDFMPLYDGMINGVIKIEDYDGIKEELLNSLVTDLEVGDASMRIVIVEFNETRRDKENVYVDVLFDFYKEA